MTYEEVIEWIHRQSKFGIKPGLERILWVLEKLGNPQKKITGIHLVGTNGKGSTVNNLQRILSSSGYRVGTFTSPYIMDFRERICIDGQMISKEDLLACAQRIKPWIEKIDKETDYGQVTEFEIITLLMFLYFGEVKTIDIAVIEAGLGGLYDSTNVFHALAVVCPSIGLDHQNILGQSYREIAQQKAGVIKGGEKVILAIEDEAAKQVFYQKAQASSAEVFEYQKDFTLSEDTQGLTFESKEACLGNIHIAMPGQHQVSNAALAIMTSLLIKNDFPNINEKSIKEALSQNYWLGRTELLAENLMIDGAHNLESVKALIQVLQEHYADKTIHFLFAAIDTKPIDQMLECLSELGELEVTSFHYPNAYPLVKYPDHLKKVNQFTDWLQKLEGAKASDFFVITGSLYFIAEVRQYWKAKENTN
ncbi:bifunctional folylpolyglutamate synthase/dihydrofolate synthase [Streptococcus catagoni]|uniref:bifunctional folylpolyglutamate synthase/dihydrofolate synthase n=1 Tax=Streptococcus catagoni TaxID=2654874 RepID=UPI00140E76B6|nr:folylpolyglutamate synthase/dihydrofolate synthase family protein [Streptococcus catagoni]